MTITWTTKHKLITQAGLFAFVGGIFVLFNLLTGYENTFIGCHDRSFSLRLSLKTKVDYVKDYIGEDDVIYCYSGLDNGERWFIYTYELAENLIIRDVPHLDQGNMTDEEYSKAMAKKVTEYFKKNKITHFLLDHTGVLTENYLGEMFDVHTGDIGLNGMAYYEIEYTEDSMKFIPLIRGQVND